MIQAGPALASMHVFATCCVVGFCAHYVLNVHVQIKLLRTYYTFLLDVAMIAVYLM